MSNVEIEALEAENARLKEELGERDALVGKLQQEVKELGTLWNEAKKEAAETLTAAGKAVEGYVDEIRQLKETIVQQAIQKQQGPQIPMTPKAVHDMLGSMLGEMEER